MGNKRYKSVLEMVRDSIEDKKFVADFEERLARRAVIKRLLVQRMAKGVSQKEIAERMGCTQGRVSKLERCQDAELRLGDLAQYAAALGTSLTITLTKKGWKVIEQHKPSERENLVNGIPDLAEALKEKKGRKA